METLLFIAGVLAFAAGGSLMSQTFRAFKLGGWGGLLFGLLFLAMALGAFACGHVVIQHPHEALLLIQS